jgi:hypothetical protein
MKLSIAVSSTDKAVAAVPKASTKGLALKDLWSKPEVIKAISKFTNVVMLDTPDYIAAVSKMTTLDQVLAYMKTHKISTSGYLYDYFDAFFILALSGNKDLIRQALAEKRAFVKQWLAFTINPSSIKAGYWSRGWGADQDRDYKWEQAYKTLNPYMRQLIPMTPEQISEISLPPASQKRMLKFYTGE